MAEKHEWHDEARDRDARRDAEAAPKGDPEFPNIEAMREFDREAHIKRSMELGATREEAERHADAEVAERDDASE